MQFYWDIAEVSAQDFGYNNCEQNKQSDLQISVDYFSSRKSPRWNSEDLQRAIELVRSGVPIKPSAEQCNIPVMTLWRRTRALGVISSRAMTYSLRPQSTSNKLHKNYEMSENCLQEDCNDRTWQNDSDGNCTVKSENFEN